MARQERKRIKLERIEPISQTCFNKQDKIDLRQSVMGTTNIQDVKWNSVTPKPGAAFFIENELREAANYSDNRHEL